MPVDLALIGAATGRGLYVLTFKKFTSMLRTPQGETVELAEAMRLLSRRAIGAGQCKSFAAMINNGNSHWCADFVSILALEIAFYDHYAPSYVDRCTETSRVRLCLVGKCFMSAQLGGPDVGADVEWSTRHARFPRLLNNDFSNCGVCALHVWVSHVTGSAVELDGEEADVLRHALLHTMVVAGRVEREMGTTLG